jgi:hypothetical protein
MTTTFHTKPRKPLKRTPLRKVSLRKTTKAAKKRSRNGIWSTKTADQYFSKYIRERDGKCLKCGITESLSCSHYFGRRRSATRFDTDNCITLCFGPNSNQCHEEWEGPKNEYTQFMIDRLGQEKFIELSLKAGMYKERREAVAECRELLSKSKI